MIQAGNIEIARDKNGFWLHPAFPWNEIPEGDDARPFIKEWGYESAFISLENDAPDEIQKRYSESNDPDCGYWNPNKPSGDGWILGAIYDTEDGPVACWLRPLNLKQN